MYPSLNLECNRIKLRLAFKSGNNFHSFIYNSSTNVYEMAVKSEMQFDVISECNLHLLLIGFYDLTYQSFFNYFLNNNYAEIIEVSRFLNLKKSNFFLLKILFYSSIFQGFQRLVSE